MCGNYSREETFKGRKLYEEIWYVLDISLKMKNRHKIFCQTFNEMNTILMAEK